MVVRHEVSSSDGPQLFGRAGLIVCSRITASLMTLLYTILITRVTSPEQVGETFVALAAAFLASVVISLNVEAGSIRFLPLYLEQERKADAAGYLLWCRRTILIMTTVVLLPLIGAALLTGYWLDWAPYLIALATAPVIANTRVNSRHAVALGLVLQATLPRILMRPAVLTLALAISAAMELVLTASSIMVVVFIAACMTGSVQWLLIRSAIAFRSGTVAKFSEARDWMILGFSHSPTLLINEYLRDIVILSAGLALIATDVARLGIAMSFISILSFGLAAVDMVASQRISRAMARNDRVGRAQLLTMVGFTKLAAFAFGAPLIWMLIPLILPLMGDGYSGLENSFLALALIPLSKAIFGPCSLILNILGRKMTLLMSAIAGVATIICGTGLGAIIAGFEGAVIATGLTVASYHGLLFLMCKRAGIDPTALATWTEKRSEQI